MKQEALFLREQGRKSLISSDQNGDDISGLLNPHDLVASTLCPAGYIHFCCSIISIHLQDLIDANVFNLFLGQCNCHDAKKGLHNSVWHHRPGLDSSLSTRSKYINVIMPHFFQLFNIFHNKPEKFIYDL